MSLSQDIEEILEGYVDVEDVGTETSTARIRLLNVQIVERVKRLESDYTEQGG